MVDGFGKRLRLLLREHGWEFLRRGRGDHEIWHNPVTGDRVTLDRGTRAVGTAYSILKKVGIKSKL